MKPASSTFVGLRRVTAAVGIVLALAWGPAAYSLGISERVSKDSGASVRLVVAGAAQAKKSARSVDPADKNTPRDRIHSAVSDSLDTTPTQVFACDVSRSVECIVADLETPQERERVREVRQRSTSILTAPARAPPGCV